MPQSTHEISAQRAKKYYLLVVAPAPVQPGLINTPFASSIGTTVGSVCHCTMGNWTNEPTSYTYQWQRTGVNIAGATSNNYTLVGADSTHPITCIVTATNGAGSTVAPASNAINAT